MAATQDAASAETTTEEGSLLDRALAATCLLYTSDAADE